MRTLDLGCGDSPRNPFEVEEVWGIDIREIDKPNVKKADLVLDAIPFIDDYFDYVTAYDFLEHIPRLIYYGIKHNPFIEVMNEIYRVLKVGGVFLSVTPHYPYPEVFRDPTHVNIITDETFPLYFDDVNMWARNYGFTGKFKILSQGRQPPHLITHMQKVE